VEPNYMFVRGETETELTKKYTSAIRYAILGVLNQTHVHKKGRISRWWLK